MARREVSFEEAEAISEQIYQEKVRPTLNGTDEPIGYFLSVDLDSGDWELNDKLHKAAQRLLEHRPNADVYTTRVGLPGAGELTSLFDPEPFVWKGFLNEPEGEIK